jgi:hypothetical protein
LGGNREERWGECMGCIPSSLMSMSRLFSKSNVEVAGAVKLVGIVETWLIPALSAAPSYNVLALDSELGGFGYGAM